MGSTDRDVRRDGEDATRTDEQAYLDLAHDCLAAMSVRTRVAVVDAAWRAPGDWDATVAHAHLTRRLASIEDTSAPLCFGRIDETAGPSWHIGRRHVEDDDGAAVVVDWRAPVAVPFYRATYRDPVGLRLRRRFILEARHLVDIIDEDFEHPDSEALAAAGGLPDPLLAELGRARTGAMRDIVATIAAEQDHIIRAPLETPLVVQGGPGTGKTAVGLHRAAFLLYEHRATLERTGVLVLGPNRLFLTYISEVLPSLGEVAVVQTTLAGLVPQWSVTRADAPATAALKGDLRMARVLELAYLGGLQPPGDSLMAHTRWGAVRLQAADIAVLVADALASGGPLRQRRTRFRRAVDRQVGSALAERRGVPLDPDDVRSDLAADKGLQKELDRIWPSVAASTLVRSVTGQAAVVDRAGQGILTAEEQEVLRARRRGKGSGFSVADLPLLDEAEWLIAGPPRRYGHVVVDEAQDLSAMALRMVARRSSTGTSFTVLGDLAQATAPGAQRRWSDAVHALGSPAGASVAELSTGYRVPQPIMAVANAVLAAHAPSLRPTASVRVAGQPPSYHRATPADLPAAAAEVAASLLAAHTTTAVITPEAILTAVHAALVGAGVACSAPGVAPAADRVTLLVPTDAKGLEFDGVVVVEPSSIVELPGGAGLLYIALTRAVQQLAIVHSGDLPAGLGLAA